MSTSTRACWRAARARRRSVVSSGCAVASANGANTASSMVKCHSDGIVIAMHTTIDAAGRVVVPKPLRDELGLAAGTELEMTAVDGHLELAIPSRVRVDEGPHGVRFVAATGERLDARQVRELMDRGRR